MNMTLLCSCCFYLGKKRIRLSFFSCVFLSSDSWECQAAQNVLRIFVYRIYRLYEFSLLREVTDILFDVFGTHLEISVSTNGMRLDKLTQLQNLRYIDAVHISRHHYDDEINRELFGGADVPGGKQLKEIIGSVTFRDIFVLNCMLLRDYINSPEEAHRFLDFALTRARRR